ncbi:transglutaminase-like domain-containing protein [Actinoplanes couchii]|uniref:Transglutaminase-like domain-containing protein n=1 Tax=Actinoplanes couchii TaxID=403638 RepID=A0ABQ3XKM6_9ACTN|nr:transglutaminase-like domain-containing protein [Actinoplanes couchii]MDR6319572.1 hypothetical protein [Actinoplanes couchii]GID59038.1 hypothetical protein Aco03nite_074420 [Actinoplanes couchii]
MDELIDFYLQPSVTSDLGRHRELLAGLPDEPEALGRVVRGLLIHDYTVKVEGLPFSDDRWAHLQTVGAEAILDNVLGIDAAPLGQERAAERRMVGFCYHFALLHCALLRATGTPARIRCGFAGYFQAGIWADHWVVEYWDGKRWMRTDPQIGRHDLSGDDFRDGITGWHGARADPSTSPAYGNGELWGWDELRGTLINDVAALNKVEVAGWYWCEPLMVEPLDQPHRDLDDALDTFARLAGSAHSVAAIRANAERYPEFQPPPDAVAR